MIKTHTLGPYGARELAGALARASAIPARGTRGGEITNHTSGVVGVGSRV